MSVEAVLPCCCQTTGICCTCHPVYGYPTSRLLTWTGSVSISRPGDACACALSINGSAPLTNYGPAYICNQSVSINGFSDPIQWSNVLDPLNCNLTSAPAIIRSGNIEEYEIGPQQYCVFYAAFNGQILRVTRSVRAPTGVFSNCNNGGNPYPDRFQVRISTSIAWNYDPATGIPYTTPNQGQSFVRPLSLFFLANQVGCNPTSFTLIPPNPNDPYASGPNGAAFDPYTSSWNSLSGCVDGFVIGSFSMSPGTVTLT